MLLAVEPLASVDLTISPLEGAFSLLDIIDELSFILAAVGPDEMAKAMHLVLLPHPRVLSAVRPSVLARTMNFVVEPVAYIS